MDYNPRTVRNTCGTWTSHLCITIERSYALPVTTFVVQPMIPPSALFPGIMEIAEGDTSGPSILGWKYGVIMSMVSTLDCLGLIL